MHHDTRPAGFSTTITRLDPEGEWLTNLSFFSKTLPDLCAIAATLEYRFEITVYTDEEEGNIVEEFDSDGTCGNYGDCWLTTLYWRGGVLPGYLQH